MHHPAVFGPCEPAPKPPRKTGRSTLGQTRHDLLAFCTQEEEAVARRQRHDRAPVAALDRCQAARTAGLRMRKVARSGPIPRSRAPTKLTAITVSSGPRRLTHLPCRIHHVHECRSHLLPFAGFEAAIRIDPELAVLDAFGQEQLYPRVVEEILGITSRERRRWTKDGRLHKSGAGSFYRGRQPIHFSLHPALQIAALSKSPEIIESWRKADAKGAGEAVNCENLATTVETIY